MKGIRAIVFLKASGNLQRVFHSWAEPQKVRWALAKRFPWLEQAYDEAISTIHSKEIGVVVSNDGRLGRKSDRADPEPSIDLIREFLLRVQGPVPPIPDKAEEWVSINSTDNTYEHASWLSAIDLEDFLGTACNKSAVISDQLSSQDAAKQVRTLLSIPGDFVAVTQKSGAFAYLVDRRTILETVASNLSNMPE